MTVAQLIARLEQLPHDLQVCMPGGDEEDFCYVAEAFEDLMSVGRWGLGLADEQDAGHFKVVRLFGASSPNPE